MRYPSTMISGVLLADGWHVVAGAIALEFDPTIKDPATGVEATPAGGAWLRFVDSTGAFLFMPLDRVLALRHSPAAVVKAGGGLSRGICTGDVA